MKINLGFLIILCLLVPEFISAAPLGTRLIEPETLVKQPGIRTENWTQSFQDASLRNVVEQPGIRTESWSENSEIFTDQSPLPEQAGEVESELISLPGMDFEMSQVQPPLPKPEGTAVKVATQDQEISSAQPPEVELVETEMHPLNSGTIILYLAAVLGIFFILTCLAIISYDIYVWLGQKKMLLPTVAPLVTTV